MKVALALIKVIIKKVNSCGKFCRYISIYLISITSQGKLIRSQNKVTVPVLSLQTRNTSFCMNNETVSLLSHTCLTRSSNVFIAKHSEWFLYKFKKKFKVVGQIVIKKQVDFINLASPFKRLVLQNFLNLTTCSRDITCKCFSGQIHNHSKHGLHHEL